MRDMVILIPGITGSVLQKDGKDIWAPSLRAIFSAVTTLGANLQQMKLHGDDPEVEDLGDGIRATALIPDARIVPGLIKVDGYTKVSEMIKGCFEVTEGSIDPKVNTNTPANFFQFPYDWRRDNRVAARRLKNLIDLRLKQWREYAGKEARVILLAHSMGGIIARYYLEVLGGFEHCKALMTFGTPFRGSVKALNYLANGGGNLAAALDETVRSFTSVYQLLPIYSVVNTAGEYRKVTEIALPGVNPEWAGEAMAFHQEIMECVDARLEKGNQSPYVMFPILGTYQPTLQSAELFKGRLSADTELPSGVDKLLGHGDGTVPYLSAIPHELSNAYRNSFYTECHGTIHCSDHVLDFIYDQLQDMQVQFLASIRGSGYLPRDQRRAAISLSVDDLYEAGRPVTIRARLLEDGEDLTDMDKCRQHILPLTAVIEPTETRGAPVMGEFQREGREWLVVQEGLPPGLYRVGVRSAKRGPTAPLPVHDLFQVAVTS